MGGVFINMDFYLPNNDRNVFMQIGERGPEECSGYGMDFLEYLNLMQDIGFSFYKEGRKIIDTRGSPSDDYLTKAAEDSELSTPINKATYYTVLIKK